MKHTPESKSAKIDRLNEIIARAEFQMNDSRNSPEIIDIFRKAKNEALRQLNEQKNAAKNEITPHLSGENKEIVVDKAPYFQSETPRKDETDPANAHILPDKCGEISTSGNSTNAANSSISPDKCGEITASGTSINAANCTISPDQCGEITTSGNSINAAVQPEIFVITASSASNPVMVKIEWKDGVRPSLILQEGEVKARFIAILRDLSDSRSAAEKNWGKLRRSRGFQSLITFYQALSVFPKPSGHPNATMEDIGRKYFISEVRKRIWWMLHEALSETGSNVR